MRIVVDWDGTVPEIDGLHLVLLEFGDERIYDHAETRLGRELTLNEVIACEFQSVRAPLESVVAWVRDNVRVRDGFAELARRHRPLVVSSGFHELIRPVLEREGLELDVRANRIDPRPDGWRVVFRDERPCPVCGEPCKRSELAGLDGFVYEGDGFSDRCVSLAATRVFARDGLARYLEEVRRFPMLEPEEEYILAKRFREHEDVDAAHRLVTSHLRLVAKIAKRLKFSAEDAERVANLVKNHMFYYNVDEVTAASVRRTSIVTTYAPRRCAALR